MEILISSSEVKRHSELDVRRSDSTLEETILELEAENSMAPQFPHFEEPPNGTVWAESELNVVIIFQIILLVILCILGTCINTLVFWVFNRRPALRSLSNRFVLSLVTANLVISSITSPLILLETVLNHYLPISCIPEAISTIVNSVIFSAIFSIFLIATDRFYAVTSPLHYSMTITRSRSQVMIVFAWLSGILLSLPHFLLCSLTIESDVQRNVHLISVALQLSLGFTFPFIGLCWLYVRMYHAAHRNSERTRKHSISGELLTVMDGSTSVIPQGIDFLTHYMNPFSKTPMIGSVIPTGPPTATGVIVTVKKTRRRSSNGSSSSLLFREEGRAIKTAFFVLASFLFCWTPHFIVILVTELSSLPTNQNQGIMNIKYKYGNWDQFMSVTGILLSSILHPFIYVFRNKMACKELTKLLCGFLIEKKRKQELIKDSHNNNHHPHNNHYHSTPTSRTSNCQRYTSDESGDQDLPHHSPPPILLKSTRRSSMKSLTPQSSLNSNSTHVNLTTHGSNDSSTSSTDSPIMLIGTNFPMKPPFLRSLTLPEQPRVKFPPNLMRQKSYVQRTVSDPPTELVHPSQQRNSYKYPDSNVLSESPTTTRRSKFVRQDSICSILSNDSVLMICADDGISTSDIRLCSNSHKIRNPNWSRRRHEGKSSGVLEPGSSSSIEEISSPSCVKIENNQIFSSTTAYYNISSNPSTHHHFPVVSFLLQQNLNHGDITHDRDTESKETFIGTPMEGTTFTYSIPTNSLQQQHSPQSCHQERFHQVNSTTSDEDFPRLLQTTI